MVAVVELIRRNESKIYEVHSDVVDTGGRSLWSGLQGGN